MAKMNRLLSATIATIGFLAVSAAGDAGAGSSGAGFTTGVIAGSGGARQDVGNGDPNSAINTVGNGGTTGGTTTGPPSNGYGINPAYGTSPGYGTTPAYGTSPAYGPNATATGSSPASATGKAK